MPNPDEVLDPIEEPIKEITEPEKDPTNESEDLKAWQQKIETQIQTLTESMQQQPPPESAPAAIPIPQEPPKADPAPENQPQPKRKSPLRNLMDYLF